MQLLGSICILPEGLVCFPPSDGGDHRQQPGMMLAGNLFTVTGNGRCAVMGGVHPHVPLKRPRGAGMGVLWVGRR
jgi:hypothetical protein